MEVQYYWAMSVYKIFVILCETICGELGKRGLFCAV